MLVLAVCMCLSDSKGMKHYVVTNKISILLEFVIEPVELTAFSFPV